MTRQSKFKVGDLLFWEEKNIAKTRFCFLLICEISFDKYECFDVTDRAERERDVLDFKCGGLYFESIDEVCKTFATDFYEHTLLAEPRACPV